ncbi:MAG: CHRD domain-containing protein [Pyrinomonadaceae bacterium]|nr:CHRD domain-containing protein [Pyrinomonadaceae bacterium]
MRRKFSLMLTIALSAFVLSTTASAQQRFVGYLTGAQEVPANNSTGKGVCTLVLNSTETQMTVNCTFSGLAASASAGHIHDTGPVGVNGPVRFGFTGVTGTSGTLGPFTFNPTPAQIADLRAKRWYFNIHSANFPGGEIRGQVKSTNQPVDFDGDGRTDIRVFRSSASAFYTLNSINNIITANFFAGTSTIGTASDDYDGDGRGDLVLLDAFGTSRSWRILQTATNTVREIQWGLTTDQVLPADYDGDGKTDVAVYRQSTGIWYIIQSSDNQTRAEVFGLVATNNDIGMVGDFDKDGKNDLTTVRGTTSGVGWFTRRSSDNTLQTVFWGGPPAPAQDSVFTAAQVDIDGDGIQDYMVGRDPNTTTTGDQLTYYIRRSSDGQSVVIPWGLDSDIKRFGDYDGDGKTDIASRRTENGQFVWYIYQSSTQTGRAVTFGQTGDLRFSESEELSVGVELPIN